MIALTVAAVGDLGTRGPFWALPTRFLTGSAAAGGIALINTFASLGGFVGPYAVGLVRGMTGSFAGGMVFLALVMLVGAIVAAAPAQRARAHGPGRLMSGAGCAGRVAVGTMAHHE